jgi:hypothetical protein
MSVCIPVRWNNTDLELFIIVLVQGCKTTKSVFGGPIYTEARLAWDEKQVGEE